MGEGAGGEVGEELAGILVPAVVGAVAGAADGEDVRGRVVGVDDPNAVPHPTYPAVLVGDPGAGGQAGGEILAVFLRDEDVEHGGAALGCRQWPGPGGAERQAAQEGGEVGGGDQVGDADRTGGEILDAAAGDAVPGPGPGPDVGDGR